MGKIFPINPKYKSALGIKFFPSILDVPDKIDNAIIAVPRKLVLKTVEQCIDKEVNVCIIFSSGFSETGTAEGIRLENELKELIKGTKTRIVGPNCLGFYCPESGISFRPDFPSNSGDVGFISQSGGNAISLGLRCSTFRLYFSKMVSFGNAVDLTAADFINYFRMDKKTKYIGMYIEGPRNGHEFFEAITLIQTQKINSFPVVLFGSHYWNGLIEWLKTTMFEEETNISAEDLDMFEVVDTVDDAVQYIENFYKTSRYKPNF